MLTPTVRRSIAFGTLALVLVAGGCDAAKDEGEGDQVAANDVYAIGCPALDTALAADEVSRRVTAATLRELRGQDMSHDADRWVDAAITVVESSEPLDLPADVRSVVVDGCGDAHRPLQNLS